MGLHEHKKIGLGVSLVAILGAVATAVGFYSDIESIFSKSDNNTKEVIVTSVVTQQVVVTSIVTPKEFDVNTTAVTNLDTITNVDNFNRHTYKIFNNCDTWEQAEKYCESLGGHLATISSQEENDYLYQMMLSSGLKSVYFGLSDNQNEGIFTWVNNEQIIYSNWHQGEPNSENQYEDYGMFYYKFNDGTWNDGDFSNNGTVNDTTAFICEWDYELN